MRRRTSFHESHNRPPCLREVDEVFADVPSEAWYADFAETLLDPGVTTGCLASPLSYCPDDEVLRDQMASFIARALP